MFVDDFFERYTLMSIASDFGFAYSRYVWYVWRIQWIPGKTKHMEPPNKMGGCVGSEENLSRWEKKHNKKNNLIELGFWRLRLRKTSWIVVGHKHLRTSQD